MAGQLNSAWLSPTSIPDPFSKPIPYVLTAFMALIFLYSLQSTKSNVPLINPQKPFELTSIRSKMEFVFGARKLLEEWFARNPDKPVRLISDTGLITVLPPKFVTEIRNDDRLSFSKWVFKAFHAKYPGFEGFREGGLDSGILQQVIQKDLTKFLNKVTEPLSNEAEAALADLFTEDSEWHTIPLKDTILQLVARLSSRVFLGEEICRNEAWLQITTSYALTSFRGAQELRLWPEYLRPLVHWFIPSCRAARAQVKQARNIIGPVLNERRRQKLIEQADSQSVTHFNDAIQWFEDEAKGNQYDPAVSQLLLSIAAIHTTTDLISQVMTDIAEHPEMIEALRKEMVTVLQEGGWKKTSLYNMKLLDSVIKESQRMKPISIAAMRRVATSDVELSDGTVVRKGSVLAVSSHSMWDSKVYNDPQQWDGYRFYRMRDMPGQGNIAQLVSTSPDHLGWGHGQHACPGRFFAANEVKIALIHILLKYDWKISGGQTPTPTAFGFSLNTDAEIKIELRRRQEEIELGIIE